MKRFKVTLGDVCGPVPAFPHVPGPLLSLRGAPLLLPAYGLFALRFGVLSFGFFEHTSIEIF